MVKTLKTLKMYAEYYGVNFYYFIYEIKTHQKSFKISQTEVNLIVKVVKLKIVA